MRKIITLLTLSVISSINVIAQENNEEKASSDYNKWSIDLNGGLSRPTSPFSTGYYVDNLSFFHGDLGVRYMFNNKFGLKTDVGFDKYSEGDGSLVLDGEYSRINLQGVMNVGRLLNFEDFSRCLNLQFHTGVGYSTLKTDAFRGKDEMVNVLLGLTGQVKITKRIAFNADFTLINNISQNYSFDGFDNTVSNDRGFNASMYNATVGFSIYLGKHKQHADWASVSKKDLAMMTQIDSLEQRVSEVETMMNDSDRDGVVDYLDVEPNTITGVAVDTKGRAIDTNNNGVPDEVEAYIEKTKTSNTPSKDQAIKDLINSGYINVYFDFNSTKPNKDSYSSIGFVVQYLKNNPNASADLIGYADEIGDSEYNKQLSGKRAENVKEIIIKSGVDASRLNIIGAGEDTSVDSSSSDARSIVRRVTFVLK
jgi:OOP family OmpA-OmpF porin